MRPSNSPYSAGELGAADSVLNTDRKDRMGALERKGRGTGAMMGRGSLGCTGKRSAAGTQNPERGNADI